MRAVATVVLLMLSGSACHTPGPYGYSARYVPVADEQAATLRAREYDPVMYARDTNEWRTSKTALFGVVTARNPSTGGAAALTLSVRRLEPRNLCSNANDEGTCRVTITDRDFGVIHVRVVLQSADDIGEHAVGVGSLVRVVGIFGEDVDATDGAPILRATYYRHWPRHFYVTRANAETMRQ